MPIDFHVEAWYTIGREVKNEKQEKTKMNEMKLMMQQMELAKMTAASIQLGQLATSKKVAEMSSELTALLNKMAEQVAKEQAIAELNR